MFQFTFYSIALLLFISPFSSSSDVVSSNLNLQNDRLQIAYVAFQAWKKAINSDPHRITGNWVGPNVCSYTGVFCAPATDSPTTTVVAGIDLNNCDLGGFLPPDIGLLADVAAIHINSNRFTGVIPASVNRLKLLYELDVSNNRFVGPFPVAVLDLPSLRYLDLRYNYFQGSIPEKLFDMPLDAIFLNNNQFNSKLPTNIGNSQASVIVLANNKFDGCIPSSIKNMDGTLNEILLSNNTLTGCLPPEIAQLSNATVIDVGGNRFSGQFWPTKMVGLGNVEEVDVSRNMMVGEVPDWICEVKSLKRLGVQTNFFVGIGKSCEEAEKRGVVLEDSENCMDNVMNQRDESECKELARRPVVCT